MTDTVFLKVQERALAQRKRYQESAKDKTVNILAYGDIGTGKTTLATTCIFPVLLHSFDPGGTKTRALKPFIKKGDIIVDSRFEKDSWAKPEAYRLWEREMTELRRMDYFSHIGTYFLDSFTTFSDYMMYELLKIPHKGGVSRAGQIPELKDYLVQQYTGVDILGQLCELPCNVVITGHIGLDKDEVTGKLETGLMLAGKFSTKVPKIFDEKYITRTIKTSTGISHVLQTKNDGYYKCETRMGGDLFSLYEQPNIRALIKKAGLPSEDKPKLI